MHKVGDAMVKYCGYQIEVIHENSFFFEQVNIEKNSHKFLSGMRNLKEVDFLRNYKCSKNLINAIAYLVENDPIETLVINTYSEHGFGENVCEENTKKYLKPFTKLKTIQIHTVSYCSYEACDRMKLLIKYSTEISSNVEIISMESKNYDWEFLEFVPKLRELYIIISK